MDMDDGWGMEPSGRDRRPIRRRKAPKGDQQKYACHPQMEVPAPGARHGAGSKSCFHVVTSPKDRPRIVLPPRTKVFASDWTGTPITPLTRPTGP